MTLITNWVMQIIIFMLIGTIIELLLPNNTMKKYINLVIGLLLLIILAKPILYLLQIDIVSQFDKFESVISEGNDQLSQTENFIEMQKKDIQAEQDAYIWNEVTSQLKNEVNHILEEEYDAHIVDISFVYENDILDNFENLEEVIVTIQPLSEIEQAEETIEMIEIDTEKRSEQRSNYRLNNDIRAILAEQWGFNKGQIQVIWEGGTH